MKVPDLLKILAAAEAAKLSVNTLRFLLFLETSGPINPSKAAELLGLTNACLHSITRKLIDSNLISKSRTSDDERFVTLEMTEAGSITVKNLLSAA